ncbi:MAG: hypothetical protein RI897_1889 [Verrucomicrobiota bacterium]
MFLEAKGGSETGDAGADDGDGGYGFGGSHGAGYGGSDGFGVAADIFCGEVGIEAHGDIADEEAAAVSYF